MTTETAWVNMLGGQIRFHQGKYRTRALEAGSGEPLILLHGVGGHAESFLRNILPLAQHFHVYAIDLLWHGLSEKPPFGMDTIPRFVEQVVDFMDTVGVDRAHIEGESLGGWVAGWVGIDHPDRVRKLVLNTTAGWHIPGQESAPGLAERSLAAVRNPDRAVIRKRLEWLVTDPARMPDEMVEIRYRIYSDPETNQALQQLFHAHLVDATPRRRYGFKREDLARLTVPTMVLWSEHNPGTGPDVGREIAGLIPGAEYACIPDCGHWPQWEKPEEHDAIVSRFLLS